MTDLRARLEAALGSTYRLERELGGGGMRQPRVAEIRQRIGQLAGEPGAR